jgi:predicted RND superfamily exporter protein
MAFDRKEREALPQSLTDCLVERYVAFLWRHRSAVLVLLGAVSIFWGFQASTVEMYSQFSDLLPQQHPYIQAYHQHKDVLGGTANTITLVIQVKEGDIFTKRTLEKVKFLTNEMELITGVDHNQISSIYHVKMRHVKTFPDGRIRSYPVLPAEIPSDTRALATLKHEMFNNEMVYNGTVKLSG